MSQQSQLQSVLRPHLDRLLDSRVAPKTICPSEVARALSSEELAMADVPSWRECMPEIRKIVAEMRGRGEVEVLQKGVVLTGELGESLENIIGPIRVRKPV